MERQALPNGSDNHLQAKDCEENNIQMKNTVINKENEKSKSKSKSYLETKLNPSYDCELESVNDSVYKY